MVTFHRQVEHKIVPCSLLSRSYRFIGRFETEIQRLSVAIQRYYTHTDTCTDILNTTLTQDILTTV